LGDHECHRIVVGKSENKRSWKLKVFDGRTHNIKMHLKEIGYEGVD
jgi:23S rRNA-/tRNA-specific pseudouridylate synthase